jgi:hypothetical protein
VERKGYTRLYATASGTLLVLAGLAGMIANAEFENPELWSNLFGFYAVNGWANSVHIALGLLALLLAPALSRVWAATAAVVFIGLAVWGILAPNGDLLFGVLPATRSVNLLNLAFGLLAAVALTASLWDRISAAASVLGRKVTERRAARRRRRQIREKRRRLEGSGSRRAARRTGRARRTDGSSETGS